MGLSAWLQSCMHVQQQCAQAGVVGGDGGIVCPRPDAFRTDVSSRVEPLSSSLREEIENGERHRRLIDPVLLFVRKKEMGESERERKKEIGDLLLSSWLISGERLFTKYCGVLFC